MALPCTPHRHQAPLAPHCLRTTHRLQNLQPKVRSSNWGSWEHITTPAAQRLTSHTDHTHACAEHTDALQTHTSHTKHGDAGQTHRSHTCARETYRRSPATKITHASVIQTRTSNKNHTNMRAKHADAHQPHKSHTCTCKTYTHQPGSSLTHTHTHMPTHTSPAWSHFHSSSPGMGQPGQGEPRHRHMKMPFSTTSGAGLTLKKQSEDTSRNTVHTFYVTLK